MLIKKCSFSYRQDDVTYLSIEDDLCIRIERIDDNIARIFLVNAASVQQPVPAHITLTNSRGAHIPIHMNEFLITWVESYTLSVNGQPYMLLNNQKQQSIFGPTGAASGII